MKLGWNDWVDEKSVPLDTLLLVEIVYSEDSKAFKTADFVLAGDGNIFGVVGDHFYFDCEIIRWASIQHLVEEE